jgi:threonine/homoserine/homoserine lactone efflux protein
MSADLFTNLLLPALVIASSPIVIIALPLLLSGPRARPNGIAFAGGWLLGLLAATALLVLLGDEAKDEVADPRAVFALLKTAAGALLLYFALRKWQARPAPGEQPPLPGWMSSIAGMDAGRSFRFGLMMAVANPKHLAFIVVAALAIAEAGGGLRAEALAVAVFVALASLTVLGSVGLYLAATAAAARVLARTKDFMVRHSAVIMAALFLFFGVRLLVDGATTLAR